MHLQEKHYLNVAQYPLHHVTYAPAKHADATSNSLGVNTFFDLDLGFRSYEVLHSTIYIMRHIQLQSLKVLCPRVKEEIHLQENTLFDL